MTLHCLYAGFGSCAVSSLPMQLGDGDSVLLLGDAVMLARSDTPWLDVLRNCEIFALSEDVRAAGIDMTDSRVHLIDYPGWLALAETHSNQRLWR